MQAVKMNTSTNELTQMRVSKNRRNTFEVRYIRRLSLVIVVGWSITKDTTAKYAALLEDIHDHFLTNNQLVVFFKYNLFNTSSASYLFKIIKKLNNAYKDGKEVKIYWSCTEEEEMVDIGLDLAGMSDFPFKITYL